MAYVAAVKCLQSSPNLLNATELPSAKSLYDDFVLTHLNQTGMIHITVCQAGCHSKYNGAD